MNGGDAQLGAHHCACCGGVHIAHDDEPIRPVGLHDFFICNHYTTGLLRMAPRAHPEMEIGRRQAEIGENIVRHGGIIMLPGMNNGRFEIDAGPQRMPERGDLHEVRPGRGDQVDVTGLCHWTFRYRCDCSSSICFQRSCALCWRCMPWQGSAHSSGENMANPVAHAPFIVGIGGAANAGSSTERALILALASAEKAGARTQMFGGEALAKLPHYMTAG